MKKLIAVLTLFLAFSINAHAQDKSGYDGLNSAEKGKKQAAELSDYLGLDKNTTVNIAALFEQKFLIMDDPNATKERKEEMSKIIDAKLRGTLDGTQINKLEKNPELYKKLIN